MQTIFMMIMIFNAFLFTQMKHPMSMGLILLIQTMLNALFTGLMSKTFWFSYILFLIFIGGMLILFIYMSSLTPNKKINNFTNPLLIFILLMFILSFFFIDKYFTSNMINNSIMINKINLLENNILMLSKMYDLPNNMITIMMISYLLLTLIVIVKITNSFLGPLRTKN